MRQLYEAFGENKTVNAWSNDPRCVISRKGFIKRIDAGWDVEKALTEPASTVGSGSGRKGNLITAFGESDEWLRSNLGCRKDQMGYAERYS